MSRRAEGLIVLVAALIGIIILITRPEIVTRDPFGFVVNALLFTALGWYFGGFRRR